MQNMTKSKGFGDTTVWDKTNHGAYAIFSNGYLANHDDKNTNCKNKSF
jgi:hypothetical protein